MTYLTLYTNPRICYDPSQKELEICRLMWR